MPPAESPSSSHTPEIPQESTGEGRTIEKKRAVLGAFVITSMLVLPVEPIKPLLVTDLRLGQHIALNAASGLQWSPYLEEYMSDLSHYSTVAHDRILIGQARMRLIVNQVRSSSLQSRSAEIPPPFVDALLSQVEDITGDSDGTSSQFGSRCE